MLLDTHIALWAIMSPHRLPRMARDILGEAEAAVSVLSLWEVAIKRGLGRGGVPDIGVEEFAFEVEQAGLSLIQLTLIHVRSAEGLGTMHSDPLDHALVAQAVAEHMTLLTADRRLSAYGTAVRLV